MNKTRIEALSDGVFSIVMTLLIIDIKVPKLEHHQVISNFELWDKLIDLWPVARSYVISFLVLVMYWTAHHAFFHLYVKKANRLLALLNNLFLMFIGCIPFTAHLLGEYSHNELAVIIYGLNVIVIGLALFMMLKLAIHHPELTMESLTSRLIIQGKIRVLMPPLFATFAILFCYVNISVSFFLFTFPIFFNIIPGTLNFLEKVFIRPNKSQEILDA